MLLIHWKQIVFVCEAHLKFRRILVFEYVGRMLNGVGKLSKSMAAAPNVLQPVRTLKTNRFAAALDGH